MKKYFFLIVITGVIILLSRFLQLKTRECYPGFMPLFKTPGDGCDFALLLWNIDYLPQALIILISVFIFIRIRKANHKHEPR